MAAESMQRFYFIGVTTGQSSIMRIFPQWMELLDRPNVIVEGVDMPLHDDPANYRRVVEQIKTRPDVVGGLVTTHKIDLLAASSDLFDALDPYATICREVSSISKENGRLLGHATDPVAGGRCLQEMLGTDYFGRTGGHVLCLGAGGAAAAIALYFARCDKRGDRPSRFVTVDIDQTRLDKLAAMLAELAANAFGADIEFELVCNADARLNDELLEHLPPSSLIINATGMGKDRPGSPLTAAAQFPIKRWSGSLTIAASGCFCSRRWRSRAVCFWL
ncbi:MAG: shikimate dehydrogenase [Caldilineaceae bacterium]